MTTGVVRLASLAACLVVTIAFILFATNQAGSATNAQIAHLQATPGAAQVVAAKPTGSNSARQFVLDASNTVTSPFHNVFDTTSAWGMHVSQLVLALLIYGFGIGFLIRAVRMRQG